jgi:hypothetical protein
LGGENAKSGRENGDKYKKGRKAKKKVKGGRKGRKGKKKVEMVRKNLKMGSKINAMRWELKNDVSREWEISFSEGGGE